MKKTFTKEEVKQRALLCGKRRRDHLRTQVHAMFGNKCVRCGHTDPRVLQIDHIYRAIAPRNSSMRSGHHLWNHILKGLVDKNDFQLLCANCNWLKKIENGEHKPVVQPQAAKS